MIVKTEDRKETKLNRNTVYNWHVGTETTKSLQETNKIKLTWHKSYSIM